MATRSTPFGSETPWFPQEHITRQEAILAYTIWAHEAAGQDYRRGFLLPKYDADITILADNLLTCNDEAIAATEVCATYVAGVRKYRNEKYAPAQDGK